MGPAYLPVNIILAAACKNTQAKIRKIEYTRGVDSSTENSEGGAE
jgi:hypothetical protein